MPYALLVGEPDRDRPTFVVPFWTRRRADAEAARARTKRGVGFILIPGVLSLPGRVNPDHLWANVVPVPVAQFLRWKATDAAPDLDALGWTGPR